jgi:hypothetical protein
MVTLIEKKDQRFWLDAAEGKICPGSSKAVQYLHLHQPMCIYDHVHMYASD